MAKFESHTFPLHLDFTSTNEYTLEYSKFPQVYFKDASSECHVPFPHNQLAA